MFKFFIIIFQYYEYLLTWLVLLVHTVTTTHNDVVTSPGELLNRMYLEYLKNYVYSGYGSCHSGVNFKVVLIFFNQVLNSFKSRWNEIKNMDKKPVCKDSSLLAQLTLRSSRHQRCSHAVFCFIKQYIFFKMINRLSPSIFFSFKILHLYVDKMI